MGRQRLPAQIGVALTAFALAATALTGPASAQTPAGPGAVHADASVGEPPAATGAATQAAGRPRNDVIEDVPVDADDASLRYGLLPYHEFPDVLRHVQTSPRVSVEVLGQSVQGRDLHLVVVTDLEDSEWDAWQRLSDLRTDDPVAAIEAFEDGAYDNWRVPVFINNTIHGNEWEGTDYFLEYVEHLAFSDDPEVLETLENYLVVGIVSQNPDGRVLGTRANANGYDLNRDYVAQTQPETVIARDQIIRYNPVSLLDTHGYVTNTLILPSTGPHGQNYEIDLYLKHSLAAAESMENAILALDEPRAIHASGRIRIPYRDNADGWGPYPPIYTPMYAMQHGGHGHTVEVPLNPRGNLTEEERLERVRVNLAVGRAAIEGNQRYLLDNRDQVLGDQLEFYRRGVAGEPGRAITDPYLIEKAACGSFVNPFDGDVIVEHCNSDVYVNEYPRAWVIPFGEGQRSDSAAIVTAQYLLDNDVQVLRTTHEVNIGGLTYGPGTFVVDQHQAKRNVAQNALETGRNLSDDWRTTYADDAFSPGALYGATRTQVWDGDLPYEELVPITDATTPGRAPDGAATFGLAIDSASGVRAVNTLLDRGIELARRDDGTFVIPGSAADHVRALADTLSLSFTDLSESIHDATPFDTLTVGFRGSATQRDSLLHLGFQLVPVTHHALNDGSVTFDELDALFIGSSGFAPENLNAPAAAAFDAWLAADHPIVVHGQHGAAFSASAGLLPLEVANAGRGDGIVSVVNDDHSKITGNAPEITFVNAPWWVTNVDAIEGLVVDQRVAEDEPFLAGHWRRYRESAGKILVVSGTARGSQVTYFGSEPTFRTHTQGLFPQIAEALWSRSTASRTEPLKLDAAASPRCVAGNVFVALTTHNTGDLPAAIEVDGAFGSRTWTSVAPGRFAAHAFNTRASRVDAGSLIVRGTARSAGGQITSEEIVPFAGLVCE